MTDLTTTTDRPLATTASAECSPELWRRLTDTRVSWSDAVARLAEDQPLGLADASRALERHVAACGDKTVVEHLAPLVTLFGVADRSEGEWTAFWKFYLDALSDLPREALAAGIAEYVAQPDSQFFPRPGPLKAICDKHAAPIRMAANRARKALEQAA